MFARSIPSPLRGVTLLVTVSLATAFCGRTLGEAYIVKDGEPNAAIVISDQAVPITKLAAKELQVYIRRITGARLPVTTRPAQDVPVRIPVAGEMQGNIDALNGVAGRRPSQTYPWYFNVCRQRIRANGEAYSALSPTGKKGFHHPKKFAKLYMK